MPTVPDLVGDKLHEQRFRMLEDIARELSGEVVFPTCFDAAIHIRKALQDVDQPLDKIAAAISVDPLIGARLLKLANSAAFNPAGVTICDVRGAVHRLGLEIVRSTAMAISMRQMLRSRDISGFDDLAQRLWRHSLQTASAAYVIARRLTRFKPDEAMFAGLVHDMGAFYMLYRAVQYEDLRQRPETVKYLIAQWHESLGVSLLGALEVPDQIIEAVRDHDVVRPQPELKTLADVVYMANLLSGGLHEWIQLDSDQETIEHFEPDERYASLKDEIEARTAEMIAIFG